MPAIWTAAETRDAEQAAEDRGVDGARLMEEAGGAVARALRALGATSVLVLAGPGKNGGDGLVAARRLAAAGVDVTIYAGGRELPALGRAAVAYGARLTETPEPGLAAADYVVDAVFGTGLSRPLAEPWAGVLAQVAASGKPVLAIDVPSGVDPDTGAIVGSVAIKAALTVTFQALKPAHVLDPGASLAGTVEVADIGLGSRRGSVLELVDPDQMRWETLDRTSSAHKYAAGRVLVVGGSQPYAGAPALSGLGALRSGAGYVELYVPASIVAGLRTLHSLPLVMRGGEERKEGGLALTALLRERLHASRTVILGPGMEAPSASSAVVELTEMIRTSRKPTVVDAGAFAAWVAGGRPPWPEAVFTPHAAEAALLIGEETSWVQEHRMEAVRRIAAITGGTAVLKGRHTLVAGPDGPVSVNLAGGSELATMGTGDVLAGVIASLLARGWTSLEAARGAVLWHGMAAERARSRLGAFSVTAVDVAEELGRAVDALRSGARPAKWPVLCS